MALTPQTSRPRAPSTKETCPTAIKDAASEFLRHRRVAFTAVSRTPGNHGSNGVYSPAIMR